MKAYKGFNKDMTCKGFQYEEGKIYETDNAKVCETGFHACQYPLDCFRYYNPAESEFHEVDLVGSIDTDNKNDTKVASTKISIGAKLDIVGLVKASIEYTKERVKPEAKADEYCGVSSATGNCGASSATGDYGASSATGDYGASSATGDCGVSSATGYKGASSATGYHGASSATGYYGASSATGYHGASSATGYHGASSATGDYGASSATGYHGASSATGNCGASSATGNYGASSATGDCGVSSATGYKGASSATGDYGASSATGNCGASSATGYGSKCSTEDPEAIAVAWGYNSKVKGVLGSYIVVTEWAYNGEREAKGEPYSYRNDKDHWHLKEAKMVQVDGEKVKADTWYMLKNGELVEVEE